MASPSYVMASGYQPLEHLSPEELDYLLKQGEESRSGMASMSDEELDAHLQNYAAPDGNVEAPPAFNPPAPELTIGEELAGAARELAGGAAFELSDEAEAAARAPFSDKSYDELVRDIRLERSKFGQAHPTLAPALNLAGGIGAMFVPGAGAAGRGIQALTRIDRLASPLARTVASGSLAGGAAGFGSGEGLGGSLENAAIGTVLGAPIGAAAHGAGRAARWGREAFTARGAEMTEDEATRHAYDIINRRLQESGLTPEQAAQMWEMEQRYGIPSVFGTVSPELARLTENVVNTPSGERADLARHLFEQQAGAPTRVASHVRNAIPTPDYFASEENITNALRRNADRAYENAYAAGDISDGRIMDFLREPDVRAAYEDALANAERLKAAAKLRGEDPSRYDLRELFVADPTGNIVKQNVPDIRTLDYVKQALDRRISSLYSSGQGSEATALRDMRNAFVDTLDTVGPPEYRAARQQYKGDIEIRDALEQGRNSNNLRWQQFNKMMGGYSPGEQQAFKTGYMQRLMQRFEDTGTNRNFARDLLAGNERRKLQALMDPGEFQVLEAALQRESELFNEISRTTRGSATFGRAAEKADIEQQIAGGNVEGAVDLLLNPSPGNIVRRTLALASNLRNANVSRATYTQLARMLRSSSPGEIDALLSGLENAGPAQQAADRALERRTTKGGVAAASTMAPPPEDTRGQTPEIKEVIIPSLDETPSVPGTAIGEPSVKSGLYSSEGALTNGPRQKTGDELPKSLGEILDASVNAFGMNHSIWTNGAVELADGIMLSAKAAADALGLPLALWKKLAEKGAE